MRGTPDFAAYVPAPLEFDHLAAGNLDVAWPPQRPFSRSEQVLTPMVCGLGLLVLCSTRGRIVVLNQFTGEQLAQSFVGSLQDEGEYSVAFDGRLLIAAGGLSVAAWDLLQSFRHWEKGRFRLVEAWRTAIPGRTVTRPINLAASGVEDGTLALVVCGGEAYAVDERGELAWKQPASVPADASAPVPGEAGAAYIVAQEGRVHRLNLATGEVSASQLMRSSPQTNLAPALQDDILFFMDEDGALCYCPVNVAGQGMPGRASELTLNVVNGFAVSPRGILVSCSRGLAMLSRAGGRLWLGDGGMDAGSCAPIVAGDVGFGIGQNQGVLYACDTRASGAPRYRKQVLGHETVLAAPAYADGALFTCSVTGEVASTRVTSQ